MYKINDGCPNCGRCKDVCPVSAIKVDTNTVITDKCINCGICVNVCPVRLIVNYDDSKTNVKKTAKKEE